MENYENNHKFDEIHKIGSYLFVLASNKKV